MIFTQHYLACLSHASYLVGDETTGRAVVVDPRRDVAVYLDEAAQLGLTIERVIETHLHADFLSGHLELAARTGAVISYGAGADVEFPVDLLDDGQRLSLGHVTLEIVATPGHTPESICVVVYEHAEDPVPYGVLTGDTLFVGDVGRPDLLATTSAELSADVLARQLYHSLHDTLLGLLPDSTRVFPAHGAGSLCGRQMSSETSSTIGVQRRTNYALQPMDEDEFVALVTEGQSLRPHYFEFDAQRNRELRPLLDEEPPPLLTIDEVVGRRAAGAVLLDAREPADFAAGHLRGAVNVGLQGRFAERAGEVLASDREVVLVGDPAVAVEAKVRLARVGYDRVVGQLDDPAGAFSSRPDLVGKSSRLTIEQLAELRGLEPGLQLVDVRSPAETAAGTLPGAREIPLAVLADSLAGLDPQGSVVAYCASGYRSLIAASVLADAGFVDVSDLLGGFGAWEAAGLPTSKSDAATDVGAAPQVGAGTAKALVEAGALLLDVRETDEWHDQHAPTAMLVPMGQVRTRLPELPGDRKIVVVCRSGGRSAAVTDALRVWGFDAVNLSGGMCAWAAAGLPVATAADPGLVVHREDPLNCETSIPALIGGVVVPNARFYVRNHFPTPALDVTTWRLAVNGVVERPLRLSLRDLQNMPSQTLVATLECAGNGRSMFSPSVDGEQWRLGAVSTAEWTGVPLVEVLDRAGPQPDATAIVLRGADAGNCRRFDAVDPLRAWPVARRRAQLRGSARLRDERRAAPAAARVPAPRHRPRVVCRHVGQMADQHRSLHLGVRGLLSDAALRLRVGAQRHHGPRTRTPPTGPVDHHRTERRRRCSGRRRGHPRRGMVGCGAHRRRRRVDRRRSMAARSPRRRPPPLQLAMVGVAHTTRRAGSDPGTRPGDRPRRPHPARTPAMEPTRLRRQRHPGHHDPRQMTRPGRPATHLRFWAASASVRRPDAAQIAVWAAAAR